MPIHNINGVDLHYHVYGEGIPIIFIHPPLLNNENFNYQKAVLANDFKVVTFDIRGHGMSGYSQQPLTYELIAEDMKQLLDHLDIGHAYVCGYSTGGTIALEAMLAYPERFIGGILISAMSEVSDLLTKTRLRMAINLSRIKAKRLLAAGISWGNADMTMTFRNLYRGALKGNIKNIGQYYRYSLDYSCTAKLNRIHQPVLLLYGNKDKIFFRYARILNERLPNNDLYFVDQMKHQIPTKSADKMNGLIREWIGKLHPERLEQDPGKVDASFIINENLHREDEYKYEK
jgi:pimeloyl-ACP methyl ester carboxylesterase